MSDTSPVTPKKAHPDNEDLEGLSKMELISRLKEQEQYIKQLENKKLKFDKEDEGESGERLKVQQKEAARKENTLVHRLTLKEQELQDYVNQITEIKQAQTQGTAQLRTMLLDPAVNIVFQRMSKDMDEAQEKLKQTQNELSAWKFTPDSQTGKRLMARCQMLLQENEELGKTISSGRTAKLEGEIALQKTLVTEMKNNQSELDEFLGDLEEDVEGMQTMIYVLQQQLRESKDQITALEEENSRLRRGGVGGGGGDHYKTFAVKQRDKFNTEIKSEPSDGHPDYKSYKDNTSGADYAPMETGYFQNEKTDSDLEAEYNYEGLYENEDKYQEELETKQKEPESNKQYDYEENGYRSYGEDYESNSQQEAMDTGEVVSNSQSSDIQKLTQHVTESVYKDPDSTTDSKHTTIDSDKRQQQVYSSMETDTQQSETVTTKQGSELTELSASPVGNGHHLDSSSKKNLSSEQIPNTDRQTSHGNGTESTTRSSDESVSERTTESNESKLDVNKGRRTPEQQRIPSPKPSKVSPNKTNSTNTIVKDSVEDESNADKSNSNSATTDNSMASPDKTKVPNQSHQTENYTESGSRLPVTDSNKESKGGIREREPVLQQFMNGITSTVDDIEDL